MKRVLPFLLVGVLVLASLEMASGALLHVDGGTIQAFTLPADIPVPGALSLCTQFGDCATVQVLGRAHAGGLSLLAFQVVNTCDEPLSSVTFETPGLLRVLPRHLSLYLGRAGLYKVSWHGAEGGDDPEADPPAVRFTPLPWPLGRGIRDGERDVFLLVVKDFTPDKPVWVEVEVDETVDRLGFLLDNPECDHLDLPCGTNLWASAWAEAYLAPPAGGQGLLAMAESPANEDAALGVRGEVCVDNVGDLTSLELKVDVRSQVSVDEGVTRTSQAPRGPTTRRPLPRTRPASRTICPSSKTRGRLPRRGARRSEPQDHLGRVRPEVIAGLDLAGLIDILFRRRPPTMTPRRR